MSLTCGYCHERIEKCACFLDVAKEMYCNNCDELGQQLDHVEDMLNKSEIECKALRNDKDFLKDEIKDLNLAKLALEGERDMAKEDLLEIVRSICQPPNSECTVLLRVSPQLMEKIRMLNDWKMP